MRNTPNQLGNKMFIINCKNYNEIAGEKIIKIAKIAEKVSRKYKIPIASSTSTPSYSINYKI